MNFSSKFFLYIVIILSAVFHEYAHGWMAHALGDDTAKQTGRLTLNPLRHIDPVGTVFVPLLFLFTTGMFIGWAKPVPYNPYNLRDQKYGSLKVGIAGPAANLLIALLLGLAIRFAPAGVIGEGAQVFFLLLAFIAYINIFLGLFNLIPIPPLDGSKIIFDLFPAGAKYLEGLGLMGIVLALLLSFYVLSPVAQFVFWVITGKGLA